MNIVSVKAKLVVGAVLAFLIVLSSILVIRCIIAPTSSKEVILQREWTANAEYAGDVWASKIGQENGFHLLVKEGSELLDPVRVVRAGSAHFGVASADRILQENEGGAGLVVIASATFKTPVVFLSRKESGIRTPKDFVGKRVGIQAGTNTELVFKAIINATDINQDQIRVVESGWGIQTFLNKDIDVLGAFDYDETIQLDMQNIEYNIIMPEDYGVNYVGTVYFTRKNLITENPKLIQDFLDYLVLGWQKTIKNPEEAMKILTAYKSEINVPKEKKSLIRGIKYFQGENNFLLYSSKERWNSMAESLVKLGRLKSFNYQSNIDYSFLEIALAKLKDTKHD